jgi:adenylate kinase
MPGRPDDRPAWLVDPRVPCAPARPGARPLRLVLLGAPGVGKGTQASLLSSCLGACHLSTGDVFRAARGLPPCDRTPALNAAVEAMERGELVDDHTVLRIIGERRGCLRCDGGFLLDGFPRTLAQAYALERLLDAEQVRLDAVVSYELPLELTVARIAGRRVCATCKAVYHLQAHPPWRPGYCDTCDTPLVQREDDRPQAVRVRLRAYQKATAPLALHYARLGLLRQVQADGPPAEVFERTLRRLGMAETLRA